MHSRRHIRMLGLAMVCVCAVTASQGKTPLHRPSASPQILAATPPMGWNSWDAYGTTVGEAQVKANADWMAAHLKQHGWQFIVVDMEWFVTNPIAEGNATNFKYSLDEYGRYTPPPTRFPSGAHGGGFS